MGWQVKATFTFIFVTLPFPALCAEFRLPPWLPFTVSKGFQQTAFQLPLDSLSTHVFLEAPGGAFGVLG